ncbi:MAG: 4-carboxymuconolactone decarboxylase [Anaerolineae bacterium]|nr:4-carboxymuconolactone decarboxylase [Anaerolineae bacterium]
MTESKYDKGMKIRREVLGDEHVDRAEKNKTFLDGDFQDLIVEVAWGSVWSRPGLEREVRQLITIAILAASGNQHELEIHLRGAKNTGIPLEKIRETLMQVAGYGGIPSANSAFAAAKKIFADDL